jgi:triosephosphate isomerase
MSNATHIEPFLIIGNWKMNGDRELLRRFSNDIEATAPNGCKQVICPPSVLVTAACDAFADHSIEVGGQDCSQHLSGAFTGDLSPNMLVEAGARWVILGHSERRSGYSETSKEVAEKAAAATKAGLRPIICIGESAADREGGKHLEVIVDQLEASTPEVLQVGEAAIAYEPVWAIGSGVSASEDQVREAHDVIAKWLEQHRVPLPVLYGGSVKATSAASLSAIQNVDGFLIGGASLDSESFNSIGANVAETLDSTSGSGQ